MQSENLQEISINQLLLWYTNKTINPKTGRKIKENGKTYNFLKKKYLKYFPNGNYFDGNSRDPVSLVDIWIEDKGEKKFVYDDPLSLIFYCDENGKHNTFELDTIKYFIKHEIKNHPITYLPIPDEIFRNVNYIEPIVKKTIKERTLDIFQIFTNISIFIDFEEFLKLEDESLSKLYYETFEFFHQNLPEDKIKLIKEIGIESNKNMYIISLNEYKNLSFEEKQEKILDSFEILLNYKDDSIKYMSYYIILGGLSLFIPKIKNDYPDFCFNF